MKLQVTQIKDLFQIYSLSSTKFTHPHPFISPQDSYPLQQRNSMKKEGILYFKQIDSGRELLKDNNLKFAL